MVSKNFSAPSPQWSERAGAATAAVRLVPALDASGFWVLHDSGAASGAFVADPGGSGFTIIDDTVLFGLRPTLLPSGMVITY